MGVFLAPFLNWWPSHDKSVIGYLAEFIFFENTDFMRISLRSGYLAEIVD